MAQAPTRRAPPARRTAAPAAAAPRRSAGGHVTGQYRGEEGMRRAEEEIAKNKERERIRKERGYQPHRFRVKDGESKEGVILDDKPEFFQFEHNAKGPDGFYSLFTGCVKEHDNCPACVALGKESYYAMYLSVLDLTPFELKDGTVVEFSRKLLVVKNVQMKKFMRWVEQHGSLRGMILRFTRDGEKESAIGNDIEFVEFMEEDELGTYVREYVDRDKKRQIDDCSQPFDYTKLFPEPTADSLRALFGGEPPAGSRAATRAAVGTASRPATRTRGAPARGEQQYEDADADGEYGEEAAPSTARRAASAAAPGTRRRAAAEEPAPETTRRVTRGAPVQEEEPELIEVDGEFFHPDDVDEESGLPFEDAVAVEVAAEEDPPPAARPVRRTRGAPPEEDGDPTQDVDDDPPPPARRGAGRTAEPTRRTAREPAGRRGAPAEEPAAAPGRRRRTAPAEAEEPAATPRRVTLRKRA